MVPSSYYVSELPKSVAEDNFKITLKTTSNTEFTYTLSYQDILPPDFVLDHGRASNSYIPVYDVYDPSKFVKVYYTIVYPSEEFYANAGYLDWATDHLPIFQGYHFNGRPRLGEIVVESISSGFEQISYPVEQSVKIFGNVTGGYSNYYNFFGTHEGEFLNYIPSDFIPGDYVKPIFGLQTIPNTDIFFLYNLGEQLVNFSSTAASVLNFKIGDFNLITLMLSGGFLLYMNWVVIKWFLP